MWLYVRYNVYKYMFYFIIHNGGSHVTRSNWMCEARQRVGAFTLGLGPHHSFPQDHVRLQLETFPPTN